MNLEKVMSVRPVERGQAMIAGWWGLFGLVNPAGMVGCFSVYFTSAGVHSVLRLFKASSETDWDFGRRLGKVGESQLQETRPSV